MLKMNSLTSLINPVKNVDKHVLTLDICFWLVALQDSEGVSKLTRVFGLKLL